LCKLIRPKESHGEKSGERMRIKEKSTINEAPLNELMLSFGFFTEKNKIIEAVKKFMESLMRLLGVETK
jgi:HD superfamily phosphodiesterase